MAQRDGALVGRTRQAVARSLDGAYVAVGELGEAHPKTVSLRERVRQ